MDIKRQSKTMLLHTIYDRFCDDINTLIHQAYNYHEYVIEGKIINKNARSNIN